LVEATAAQWGQQKSKTRDVVKTPIFKPKKLSACRNQLDGKNARLLSYMK
jgi:hypothetical protein